MVHGNAGLVPAAAAHPTAPGFGSLKVATIDQESADVLSLTLQNPDGQPLPPALPGQFREQSSHLLLTTRSRHRHRLVTLTSATPLPNQRSNTVNRCVLAAVLSTLLVCIVFGDMHGVSAQSAGRYKVDANWARLPAGTTWNGNTTWITADGKGQVVVLVRTAPYFRVLSRDGAWVKAFGEQGLFESAHSVTIDAQGNLWVTDFAAHVVQKFSADGRVLMTLGKKGVAGDNASRELFNQPNHVAVAPNGDIYVSDGYVNARVVQGPHPGQ
jgi:sugar lactone lactonase YvrE